MTEHHPTPETEKSSAFPWLEWTNIREHLAALTERVASLITRVDRLEERFNTRFTRLEGELKDLREEIKSVKSLLIWILIAQITIGGGVIAVLAAALLMK